MINAAIIRIKDSILNTVSDDCEKIILFGSYAHGTPREDSDYDFYVVLRDEAEKPILVLQKIYRQMCDTGYTLVDVLADYRNQFEWRSTQPTIERTISNTGMVLYDAAFNNQDFISCGTPYSPAHARVCVPCPAARTCGQSGNRPLE
jgi:predicted nucleotidyltransferase